MNRVLASLCFILSVSVLCGYEPTEVEKSAHHGTVYSMARNYVQSTFNLELIEESRFVPVRFDSRGLWGDFEARIEDLGQDWYEVHGWFTATGHDEEQIQWSVVVHYRLEDPRAWRYRRIDKVYVNEPTFSSWRFGMYRSVPYIVDIASLTVESS